MVRDGIKCDGDCRICAQSCLDCNGVFKNWPQTKKYNFNVHVFKPYFDVTLGHEVTSKREIREYCAAHDMVYAGDRELTQQCEQNRRDLAVKKTREFERNLTDKLMGIA